MEPDGRDSPPLWPPTSTTVILQHQHRRRRLSPLSFLSPVTLILLLPILLLLIIFFVISPFLSHTTQFLRLNLSVKKSWDSLNVLLVVFAILCGVFARWKEEVPAAGDQNGRSLKSSETTRSSHYVYNTTTFEPESETVRSSQWYNTTPVRPETETVHDSQYWYDTTRVGPENRLRRSSSSYPDSRQGSFWDEGENRFRFYDDLQVNFNNRSPGETPPASDNFDGERRSKEEGEDTDVKVIPVDTFEVRSSVHTSPPASPPKSTLSPTPPPELSVDLKQRRSFHNVPRKVKIEKPKVFEAEAADDQLKENPSPIPAPPPPPEPMVSLKQRRSFHSVPRKEKVEKPSVIEEEFVANQLKENFLPPPAPPPPPPPPQLSPELQQYSEQTHQKHRKKKSGTAKELTNAISSLYNQQKRKKNGRKRNAEESSSESSPPSTHSTVPPQTPPPAPPPPPPPPSKVFHNLFKKSSKSKRQEHSETSATTPLPPPPPSPNSIFNNIFKTGSRSKRFIPTSSSGPPPPPPPPLPPASSILNTLFKQGSRINRFKSESSITRPPPPPPPPPPKQHVSSKRKSKNSQYHFPKLPRENMIPRTTTPGKPPLPAKSSMYYDEYLNSGSQSPLVTNPSPPPLPPFQMPEFEFVGSGDFVRIRSDSNSRCSSPGLEDVDDVAVKSSEPMDGSDTIGPSVFCPSPDVNAKADSFIARLKDEWRLEKMNSVRKKQLGPSPSPKANP